MISELNHLGIFAEDAVATETFYTELFGARVVWRASVDAIGLDLAYLQIGDGLVEILSYRGPGQSISAGTDHLGFITDDLDADHALLVSRGYESVVEPKPAGSGVGRQSFLLDSNGVRIELIERDLLLRQETADHPVVQAIDHYSLRTDDLARSLDLFHECLGMPVLRELPISSGGVITYVHLGSDVLEFLTGLDSGPRLHHIALRVRDVDAALEAFEAAGYRTDGPSRAAGTGYGRLGSITDPNGVMIELLDRPPLIEL